MRKMRNVSRRVLEPKEYSGFVGTHIAAVLALVVASLVGLSSALTVDIDPDGLNIYNNEGNYITVYLEGPFENKVLFEDDFEIGWTSQHGGTWKVVEESASDHVMEAMSAGTVRGGTIFSGVQSWTDYVVEASVLTTDSYWGIVVRADSTGSSWYSTYLNSANGAAEIWKRTNDVTNNDPREVRTMLGYTSGLSIMKNTWYDVKTVVSGSSIQLFFKLSTDASYPATPQVSATDSTWLSGRIGLVFYDETAALMHYAWYDDITVTDISGSTVLYEEDFEGAWTVVPGKYGGLGKWIIEKDSSGAGEHSLDWVYSPIPAAGPEEISVVSGDVAWTNYVLEYNVKISNEDGGSAVEGSAFVRADENAENGYLIHPEIGGVAIWKKVKDSAPGAWDYTNVVPTKPYAIAAGNWYAIRAEVDGANIQVFVDGNLVVDWTDPGTVGPVLTSGKIGLRLGADARHAHFDDVVVREISYDVSQLDVASLRICYGDLGNIYAWALPEPTCISDYDMDGIQDLMVKFPRADVVDKLKLLGLQNGVEVELIVAGETADGVEVSGTDSVKVVKPLAKGKLKL